MCDCLSAAHFICHPFSLQKVRDHKKAQFQERSVDKQDPVLPTKAPTSSEFYCRDVGSWSFWKSRPGDTDDQLTPSLCVRIALAFNGHYVINSRLSHRYTFLCTAYAVIERNTIWNLAITNYRIYVFLPYHFIRLLELNPQNIVLSSTDFWTWSIDPVVSIKVEAS